MNNLAEAHARNQAAIRRHTVPAMKDHYFYKWGYWFKWEASADRVFRLVLDFKPWSSPAYLRMCDVNSPADAEWFRIRRRGPVVPAPRKTA